MRNAMHAKATGKLNEIRVYVALLEHCEQRKRQSAWQDLLAAGKDIFQLAIKQHFASCRSTGMQQASWAAKVKHIMAYWVDKADLDVIEAAGDDRIVAAPAA